ncbi:MAG: hypothetical protein AAF481_00205 [Acidobacteriota bacterium]
MPEGSGARRPAVVAAVVALVALAVIGAGVFRTHDGDWTGPFLVGERGGEVAWPLPVAVQVSSGYDGQFFLALAFDPFLTTGMVEALDDAEYRAHRITWSLAAWSFGLGSAPLRIAMLYALLVAGVAALGYWIARLSSNHGESPWWGIAGALGLGGLVCLQRMLPDVLMASFLAAMVVCLARRSRGGDLGATVCFTLAVLQKETAILALPQIGLALIERHKGHAVKWLAVPVVTVAGWWGYVDRAVATDGHFSLAIPFSYPGQGWFAAMDLVLERSTDLLRLTKDCAFLGLHAVAILLGLTLGLSQLARAMRGWPVHGLAASIGLFALLGTFLSLQVWVEPWAYARVLLPLLMLLLLYSLEATAERWVRLSSKGVILASFLGGSLFALRNIIAAVP